MQWFRFYDEVLDDPKVQRLSPELFKHWINLLCLANKGGARGRVTNSADEIAFRLRVSADEAGRIMAALVNAGLIEFEGASLVPHHWDERQFKSDDVNVRVRGYRARVDAALKEETLHEPHGETLHEHDSVTLDVTPPEQIQIQNRPETEEMQAGSRQPYPEDFETFWRAYGPTNGPKKPAYVAWKNLSKANKQAAIDNLPSWLASQKWCDGFKDYPQKYLNQRFWETVPAPARSPNGAGTRATAEDFLRGAGIEVRQPG